MESLGAASVSMAKRSVVGSDFFDQPALLASKMTPSDLKAP